MENFTTLTETLRSQILYYYEVVKQEFNQLTNNEDESDYDENIIYEDELDFEIGIDEIYLEDCEEHEIQVFNKVINYINSNKYKNIIYLIMMQDAWEYLKTKEIANIQLFDDEQYMIAFLEDWDLKNIFNKINSSKEFVMDLFVLFIEYHYTHEIENRMINRKLIELAHEEKNYNKFKIKVVDDIHYQYKKTGKIH